MQETVIFKFKVFDESIREEAEKVASEFPGVTSVDDIRDECKLMVTGEFNKFEMTKKLKEIDEYADIIDIIQPEVNKPPDAGGLDRKTFLGQFGYRPTPISKVPHKPSDADATAGSSKWLPHQLWDQALDYGARAGEIIGKGKEKVVKFQQERGKAAAGRDKGFNHDEVLQPQNGKGLLGRVLELPVPQFMKPKKKVNLIPKHHMNAVKFNPNKKREQKKPSDASSSKKPTGKKEGEMTQGLTQGFNTGWMDTIQSTLSTVRTQSTVQGSVSTRDQQAQTRKKESRSVVEQKGNKN